MTSLFLDGYSPPLGYRTPPWPSLYNPFDGGPNTAQYLYYGLDIWRFTLYWTFAIFGGVFLTAGLWAGSVLIMKTKWAILVPLLYCVCGILVALVTGTIVGFALAALYSAGFKMSTWIPFFWGLIQMLTVVSAGYSQVTWIL